MASSTSSKVFWAALWKPLTPLAQLDFPYSTYHDVTLCYILFVYCFLSLSPTRISSPQYRGPGCMSAFVSQHQQQHLAQTRPLVSPVFIY